MNFPHLFDNLSLALAENSYPQGKSRIYIFLNLLKSTVRILIPTPKKRVDNQRRRGKPREKRIGVTPASGNAAGVNEDKSCSCLGSRVLESLGENILGRTLKFSTQLKK